MNGKSDVHIGVDKNQNIFLADCISLFHTIIVLFIIFAPFTKIPALLVLHITFSISLIVHWYYNNNACSLTFIEAKLRGLDEPSQSFTHKFIAPLYDISNTEWSTVCYIITATLMLLSFYYLYNSEEMSKCLECYNKRFENPEYNNLNTFQQLMFIFECFKPLLILRLN